MHGATQWRFQGCGRCMSQQGRLEPAPPGPVTPGSGTVRQVEEIMTAAGPARVVLERQDRPAFLLVLTHGAGGTRTPPTCSRSATRPGRSAR